MTRGAAAGAGARGVTAMRYPTAPPERHEAPGRAGGRRAQRGYPGM